MILRMTIAVKNMEGMVAFYESVFGLKFKSENLFGAVLYHAKWNNLEIQFCPAEIAKNTAKQNRHQLEIKVDNLSSSLENVKKAGGSIIGVTSKTGNLQKIGIYDPDNNSIVLVEKID